MKNNHESDDALAAKPAVRASSTPTQMPGGWTESSADWVVPPSNASVDSPRAEPAALQASGLSVSYGKNYALQDVTFTLNQGDTLGLLGLNGAGKSTLLKVLSGAVAPATGTVQIGDQELFANVIDTRMQIGYAPDTPAVFPEFRVTEFLRYIARMRRINKRQINTSVNSIVERCGLGEVGNRIIGNLSTGYQQRVNIAQALIHSPKILILDEPGNGLDPVQLMEIRQLVSNLAPQQATIFSSHLLSEVNAVCNRVLVINSGRQVFDASLTTLSDQTNRAFEITLTNDNRPDQNPPTDHIFTHLPGVNHACKATDTKRWLVSGESLTAAHLKNMLQSRGLTVHINNSDNFLESLFKQLADTTKPATTGINSTGRA